MLFAVQPKNAEFYRSLFNHANQAAIFTGLYSLRDSGKRPIPSQFQSLAVTFPGNGHPN